MEYLDAKCVQFILFLQGKQALSLRKFIDKICWVLLQC